jgi:hypothetical protein
MSQVPVGSQGLVRSGYFVEADYLSPPIVVYNPLAGVPIASFGFLLGAVPSTPTCSLTVQFQLLH